MATTAPQIGKVVFVDKKAIQKIVAEQNRRMGFVPDPHATAEKALELMRAQGIRPEDNIASCGIIAARNECTHNDAAGETDLAALFCRVREERINQSPWAGSTRCRSRRRRTVGRCTGSTTHTATG